MIKSEFLLAIFTLQEAGQQHQSRKIFVARISDTINTDDLHQ
jgi:hypothetical protein